MQRSVVGNTATVLIGDSITEGFWWNSIGDCRIVNAGFAGINADGVAARLPIILQGGPPKYAIVMLGSNNTNLLPGNLTFTDAQAEAFEARYSQIVDTLRNAGTTVIVVSIPPIEPEKLKNISRSKDAIIRLNTIIRDRIAAPRGLTYVDLYDLLLHDSDITTDGIHFSPATYRKYYDLLNTTLSDVTAKSGKSCN